MKTSTRSSQAGVGEGVGDNLYKRTPGPFGEGMPRSDFLKNNSGCCVEHRLKEGKGRSLETSQEAVVILGRCVPPYNVGENKF